MTYENNIIGIGSNFITLDSKEMEIAREIEINLDDC